eukprot:5209031-Prymnesium_polylepis.1
MHGSPRWTPRHLEGRAQQPAGPCPVNATLQSNLTSPPSSTPWLPTIAEARSCEADVRSKPARRAMPAPPCPSATASDALHVCYPVGVDGPVHIAVRHVQPLRAAGTPSIARCAPMRAAIPKGGHTHKARWQSWRGRGCVARAHLALAHRNAPPVTAPAKEPHQAEHGRGDAEHRAAQ